MISYGQTNILLNDSTNKSNYQTCIDEAPSIDTERQSDSSHNSSPQHTVTKHRSIQPIPYSNSISRISNQHQQPSDQMDDNCKICIGRVLKQFKPYLKWVQRIYYVVLCNAVIVCTLLIISRIFSDDLNSDNNLFHSNIFMSDSPPLLLTANIVMMISYSLENFLALRICLAIGCSCFALWGLTSHPMLLDAAMFNTVMMLLNARHAVILSYHLRHIEFEQCWEQIYVQVFKGYLNRVNFNKLVHISYKRKMKKGEIFKKKDDEVTSLCCLVSGRIKVVRELDIEPISKGCDEQQPLKKIKSKCLNQYGVSSEYGRDIAYFLRDPHFVNLCHKNQFIEAPQWVHANLKPLGHRFSVYFVAVDDCEYIKWPKENLIDLIEANSDIYHALSGVLGLHTAHALLKSREYTKIQHKLYLRRADTRVFIKEKEKEKEKNEDHDTVVEIASNHKNSNLP